MSPLDQTHRASAAVADSEPEAHERRAMVRVARIATDRAVPHTSSQPPRPVRVAVPPWQQAAYVAAAWTYMAPFLWLSPFLVNPPVWVIGLAGASERREPDAAER